MLKESSRNPPPRIADGILGKKTGPSGGKLELCGAQYLNVGAPYPCALVGGGCRVPASGRSLYVAVGCPPTVHENGFSCHIARVIRGQEERDFGNLTRVGHPFHRASPYDVFLIE